MAELIGTAPEGSSRDPFPTKAIASLAIFTSHIGRAVCLHYKDGDAVDAEEELRTAITHLKRCAMDACKLTLDYLNSHPDLFGKKYKVADRFWKTAIAARVMEHDRVEIEERIGEYEKLHPVIKDFVAVMGKK